ASVQGARFNDATATGRSTAGLGLAARYHFLALGRFAPYVEVGAAAGGTNLRVVEIDSSVAFRLELRLRGQYRRALYVRLLPMSKGGGSGLARERIHGRLHTVGSQP